jgi:DNA-binding LacI/PurR family transcriptional regulator
MKSPPKHPKATIADVARVSGVAKATVSKALGPPGRYAISEEVRRRVIDAAGQLGYFSGGRGRSSGGSKAGRIGLIYFRATPSPSETTNRIISALAPALLTRNCQLVHVPLAGPADGWGGLLKELSLAGCVVIEPPDPWAEAFLLNTVPLLMLLNVLSDRVISQVIPDIASGADRLTRHLLDLGHRRIALCMGKDRRSTMLLRRAGFETALRRASCEADGLLIHEPEQFAEKWSTMRPRPTALIADTLTRALDLLQALSSVGIRVPADLSLATFEDAYPAEKLIPSLTAIRTPAEQIAQEAATLLADQIEGRQSVSPRKIVLPESLILRQSTSAPHS